MTRPKLTHALKLARLFPNGFRIPVQTSIGIVYLFSGLELEFVKRAADGI